MAMNLSLDIDYELADRITVANLKASYEMIGREIDDLERIERQPYQEEDYQYALKNRKAIKKVLRYFMLHSEAENYFNG